MGKDALSVRMKEFYEMRTRTYLPRRTYTIIRIDGKAFHTYTRGLKKPFDLGLIEDMDETAKYLCKNIQGAKMAFVQSDEISIVLTDFDTLQTDAWFDGEVQKIVSISASMATSKFNQLRTKRYLKTKLEDGIEKITDMFIDKFLDFKLAEFDSRVFIIPFKDEVLNYLIWRQHDTVRNSISSVAQSMFSPKELHGKNQSDMQEMCFQKGTNWNDFDDKLKRGRLIIKQEIIKNNTVRKVWVSIGAPTFTQDRTIFDNIIQ